MVLRFFRMIRHGTLMMVRTLRNYAMLSMSVVLSFSVLLGYLVYADSSTFNEYKYVMYKPEGRISVVDINRSNGDMAALLKLTEGIPSYVLSEYQGSHIRSQDGSYSYNFIINTIPTSTWGLIVPHGYPLDDVKITWLDGREPNGVVLNKGEILISQYAYDILFGGKEGEPILPVCVNVKDSSGSSKYGTGKRWMDCKVVGTVDSTGHNFEPITSTTGKQKLSFHIHTFMSQATMDEMAQGAQPQLSERWVIYDADNPEYVVKAAEQVGMLPMSIYEKKAEALKEMQLQARMKMIIVLLMFVILGINLYGSFSNALERRRFEVGIKRAIGASKAAIIGQFLWESLLLMLINTFISVVLVFNGFLWYKYYWEWQREFNPYWKWTIYLNGTSILMFAVVSLALTLLFSVIFAVKATQVQVVEYLKAE